MTDDYCGWPTADGTACEHPVTEDNGRCWQHCEDAKTGGRPTKFNDERARAAVNAAQEAKSVAGCGRAAGVDRKTIINWAQKNPEYAKRSECPKCAWETTESDIPEACPRCDDQVPLQPAEWHEFFPAFMQARAKAETLLTRGPLVKNNDQREIDGQHARFLLKTSFNYKETTQLEIEDMDAADRKQEIEELVAMGEDLF